MQHDPWTRIGRDRPRGNVARASRAATDSTEVVHRLPADGLVHYELLSAIHEMAAGAHHLISPFGRYVAFGCRSK